MAGTEGRGPTVAAEDFDLVEPEASVLSESLRAFSYELPSAIADLVDNSISAHATDVWVDFGWAGKDSTVTITDNGTGMSEPALVAAMRPGSKNPLSTRNAGDLGRFGLGLKTASFSQCRRVTVRTRPVGGTSSTRCWDLDHVARVNAWQLLRTADGAAEEHLRKLDALPHGTAVIWQRTDRIVGDHPTQSDRGQQLFHDKAHLVGQHLSMVFHQLMVGRNALSLTLNSRLLAPWDPFLADHPATQKLPGTTLKLRKSGVAIEPFVLPHHSKLSKAQFAAAAGRRGWTGHQGFYVYRHRRLLVPGDWLGFGWTRDEHYKLARIKVEFTNELDHDWAIDVTKSRALPPSSLREDLRIIAERTRELAKRVYSFRGALLTSTADSTREMLWDPVSKHDKTFYRLNQEHPLIKQALSGAADRPLLAALFRLIEETVPTALITIQNSDQPRSLPGPFEGATEKQITEVMVVALRALIGGGCSGAEAAKRLRSMWPFELYPALLQGLLEAEQDHG